MATINQDDVIESVADSLQNISYYHLVYFIQADNTAYAKEVSKAAKDAMAQILINSRMCAVGHRPICQDTGIVTIFIWVEMDVQWDAELSSYGTMISPLNREELFKAVLIPRLL